jgi:hypothetical protein
VRIVADTTIGILVCLTKSGIVKTVSLLTGDVLGQIDFHGDVVNTILITQSWHLVVIECDKTWHFATIRGDIVKRSPLYKQIATATTFRGPSGHDYVAFVDRERFLHVTDALHSGSLQTVGKIKGDGVAIDYIRTHQLVVAIDTAGVVTTFRFPGGGGGALPDAERVGV